MTVKDAGKPRLDASVTIADSGARPSDAGTKADSSTGTPTLDAGKIDAATPPPGKTDAATADAGKTDAGKTDASTGATDGGSSSAGSCSGATPHGCYTPKSDNTAKCLPQIHEQSAYYPPGDEWEACDFQNYTPCNYTKPGGGADAHCECDLGFHWLCTY